MIIREVQAMPPLPKRKRVAAYVRVSSGKDAMLHSLSAQVSYYSDYIQRHPGWEYVGVYTDEAYTGTKDIRPEFQRLLTDCRDGKVDMVVTKSISRFARNTVTMLEAVRELKALNIDVWFEKENIHSLSGDGELMLTILASFAQEESRSVSENCKWRIRKQFQEGKLANLRYMFGYQVGKNSIAIDASEAKIVRDAFDAFNSGVGCNQIARQLREKGIPCIRGGQWTPRRVRCLLQNEKYTGGALLQKRYVIDHLTKVEGINHGVLPKYYAEGTHAPIVDMGTFQAVQARIEENRTRCNISKQASKRYPFSGKIVCANCGKHYLRKVSNGKAAWNCSTYLELGKSACHTKQIPEDVLFSIIAEVLNIPSFDEDSFYAHIKEIRVPEFNHLVFVFHDGHTVERTWQDRSRRDSWDGAAKERARQRQQEYMEKSIWNRQ